MSKKVMAGFLVVMFVCALSGCATESGYDPARSTGAGALGGAAVGAALGSIIGAATGSASTGAWVGAAAGGLVGGVGGFLYAQHQNNQIRNAQMAQQTYGYSPGRGNIVAVEQTAVSPSRVRPGDQVKLDVTYTLLTPENQTSTATIIREVTTGGRQVVQPYQVTATNPNGTYSDTAMLTLPKEAPRGSYMVVTKVMTDRAMDQRSASFTVE